MWAIWGDVIRKGDPYYNPNLTLTLTDWSLAADPATPRKETVAGAPQSVRRRRSVPARV